VYQFEANGIACKPIDGWFSANQADLGKYGDEFKPGNDEKFTHRLERKV
jgi:hypothetical protein